jgi:hypothetical protein
VPDHEDHEAIGDIREKIGEMRRDIEHGHERLNRLDEKLTQHLKEDVPLKAQLSKWVITGLLLVGSVIGMALVREWTEPLIAKLAPHSALHWRQESGEKGEETLPRDRAAQED